jgi:hypothetical protein
LFSNSVVRTGNVPSHPYRIHYAPTRGVHITTRNFFQITSSSFKHSVKTKIHITIGVLNISLGFACACAKTILDMQPALRFHSLFLLSKCCVYQIASYQNNKSLKDVLKQSITLT